MKDRKEHVDTKIGPALASGKVVIVDRYYFSTAAYQGCKGFDPEKLLEMNEAFAPEPDLLLLLDLAPEMGLQRIRTRGDRANHFEQTSTLKLAREIFLSIRKPYMVVIDARKSPEEIRTEILAEFDLRYNAKLKAAASNCGEFVPKGQ